MASVSIPEVPHLSAHVASGDALDVRHFSVEERISSLFTISLVVLCRNENVDFDMVVGQPGSFTLRHGLTERTWTGVVNHFEQLRVLEGEDGTSTYQLTIVPSLWFATQRRNHRMFQQISEPDIVRKLLGEWKIQPEVELSATYKKRKYRVQYAESDYAFLSRMLEDAGISFCFREVSGKSKLVLTDAPQAREARLPIAFRDTPTDADLKHVTNVRIGQHVRPGKYTIRDHDYRLPPSYNLAKSATQVNVDIEQQLERFHYTPGAFLFGADKGEDTPSADDRGKTRTDEKEGEALAKKRLEAKRSNAKVCTFETNAHDLSAGTVVTFLDHPRADLKKGKRWLVVSSVIAGAHDAKWSHSCEARSADLPFRPPVTTPKPRVIGIESATVVGPAGEEIHTDEFGRVRVHFHWDRESKMDDNSSCWIHVSQPWSGGGFGGTNLPRVGQEVIVDFLGGDPDRPVIVGRLYTNLQKTPYKLPANKTQSGWKSESTPGGGGFNEMRFEDAKGKEQVYMQAEKDLQKLVKNNEDVNIGNNRTKTVGANDVLTVIKNRTKTVLGNEVQSIALNKRVSVGINRATQVGAIDSTVVGEMAVTAVSPPGEGGWEDVTRWILYPGKVHVETRDGAKLILDGKNITLDGETITIKASKKIVIESSGDDVQILGGPKVKINTR